VNHSFLDLEAGINRVAVRATRMAGTIVVRATSAGLEPASITIESRPFVSASGMSTAMPAMPAVRLAAARPAHPNLAAETSRPGAQRAASRPAMVGRFVRTLEYSGPGASIVHVETNAANGRNVYVDRDYRFDDLPASLSGDWTRWPPATNAIVRSISPRWRSRRNTVTIAHDPRVPAPGWLTAQFQPAAGSITVNGQAMRLYTRQVDAEQSLTLGSNNEAAPRDANMYLVFVTKK
jgi:beta-galactosidase